MHRKVDSAGDERLLDLLGEEALAAGIRKRAVADRIAGGADDLERDLLRGKDVRSREAIAHLLRLGERQRATARTDDERGGSGRGRCCGLHPMTSRCYAGLSRPKHGSPDGASAKSGLNTWVGCQMLVLGIETTCDETGAAVVERLPQGPGRILSNIVLSQIDAHAAFGGGRAGDCGARACGGARPRRRQGDGGCGG